MAKVTATDAARTGPVHVQKNGRDAAVVISPEVYARYAEAVAKPKVRPAIEELLQCSVEKRKSLYEALAK